MTIKTYKGRITVLGDSVASSNAAASAFTYSYIELEGGVIIRRVKTLMGLNGKLKTVFNENELVELHFNEILTGVPDPGSVLLAIRMGNGRLYASHIPAIPDRPFILSVAPLFCLVFGIVGLPFFGIGFLLFIPGWEMYKNNRKAKESRKLIAEATNYIKSLNGAIEL